MLIYYIGKRFFYKRHFYKQRQAEFSKILSSTLYLNLCHLKIIYKFHPRCYPKIIGHIAKIKQKNKCVCIHVITRLTIIKIKMEMKKWSHRYNINRPSSWYGHKYSKYDVWWYSVWWHLYVSNIWSSIHKKVKQHWGWVEKKRCL